MCVVDVWDLTYSENHWPNLEMIKRFVEIVMVPYHRSNWITWTTNKLENDLVVKLLECT
jgi:hypothetical protein